MGLLDSPWGGNDLPDFNKDFRERGVTGAQQLCKQERSDIRLLLPRVGAISPLASCLATLEVSFDKPGAIVTGVTR